MKFPIIIISLITMCASSVVSQTTTPEKTSGDEKIIAVVLGEQIKGHQKKQLNRMIFSSLLDQYAKNNNIEVTDDELKVCLLGLEAMTQESLLKDKRVKSRLVEELKSDSLSAVERKQKLDELDMLELSVQLSLKKQKEEVDPELQLMAKQWIRAWKIDSALFKQYGGRVIFQQTGPEPLDAYRDFLIDHQKLGSFKIMAKADEASFWKYFTNQKMHTFYSLEKSAAVMKTPFWLMDKPEGE